MWEGSHSSGRGEGNIEKGEKMYDYEWIIVTMVLLIVACVAITIHLVLTLTEMRETTDLELLPVESSAA